MSLADYAAHTCDDHSHSHLTKAQVYELQSHGAIEWLRGSLNQATPKMKAVLRIRRFFLARGLSCSVGAGIAIMLCGHNRDIANSMLDNIFRDKRNSHSSESERVCVEF
jgi:hypothetical protein